MGLTATLADAYMRLHQSVYIKTDGRIGHGLVGVPSLLLRTTGRRTGSQRTIALIYARDGEDYVLVASNNARASSPGWYFNLVANPNVEIQVGRRRIPSVARAVGRGDPEFDRLWRLVNEGNHGRYDAYQARTPREIALVVVRPL